MQEEPALFALCIASLHLCSVQSPRAGKETLGSITSVVLLLGTEGCCNKAAEINRCTWAGASPEELLVRQGRESSKDGLEMAMEQCRREFRALQTALGCFWSLVDPANEVFIETKHLHTLAEGHRRFLQRE